jgi:hypothetical protein
MQFSFTFTRASSMVKIAQKSIKTPYYRKIKEGLARGIGIKTTHINST